MRGDPELMTLTPDLKLVSDGRPAGDGPAWVESGLRHRLLVRLRVAVVLASLAVLLWGAGFWFLTRPFHEIWPATAATVVRTHEFYAKGTHCEVYLQLASSPQQRTVMFSGFAPCRELPPVGHAVTVTVDPADASSVRIIGYDRPLWGDIVFALVLLGQPILWASAYLLVALVRFRRGRKAGGSRPWRAVTARFVASTVYRGSVSARLWALVRREQGAYLPALWSRFCPARAHRREAWKADEPLAGRRRPRERAGPRTGGTCACRPGLRTQRLRAPNRRHVPATVLGLASPRRVPLRRGAGVSFGHRVRG